MDSFTQKVVLKGHLLVTLGKTLFLTFIVQVYLETDISESVG